MAKRTAKAVWKGNLEDGAGTVELGSGRFRGEYSAKSRFGSGAGTNPEELIGAAHAGCFSMALAHGLDLAGHAPESIETTANVSIEKVQEGYAITRIDLDTRGRVPGIDDAEFRKHAETAKKNCPVSQALAATTINLTAKLIS